MTTPRQHAELNKHKGNQVPLMSAAEVNALPPKAREYIHQLESNADPAGMVRENMQLWDTNKGLQIMYRNRTDELDRVQQDLEKANSSAEHFEREWCLRGDELDTLRAQLAKAQREAVSLAKSLFKRHYAQEPHYASGRIEWKPFNEPASVISQIDNMVAGISTRLVEAQRDMERLDWIIEHRAYVVSDPDCCDGYWLNYARPDGTVWTQATEHETPRAAIDAAMGEPS